MRVGALLTLDHRNLCLSVGSIEVAGPDDEGRCAVTMVLSAEWPNGPANNENIPLDNRQLWRLKRTNDPRFDYFYRGSLHFTSAAR